VLDNKPEALLPGYFARVRIPYPHSSGLALLVPDAAIGASQAGRYVLVVDKDNVVQSRMVETGQTEGSLRVIEKGLAADDQVIVSGVSRAVPGEKVTPKPAPMPEA
jgi:RND family efflux transporter MFP subunit